MIVSLPDPISLLLRVARFEPRRRSNEQKLLAYTAKPSNIRDDKSIRYINNVGLEATLTFEAVLHNGKKTI